MIGSFNTVKYDWFPNRFEINQSISLANICMIFIDFLLPNSNIPAALLSAHCSHRNSSLHFSLSLAFSFHLLFLLSLCFPSMHIASSCVYKKKERFEGGKKRDEERKGKERREGTNTFLLRVPRLFVFLLLLIFLPL